MTFIESIAAYIRESDLSAVNLEDAAAHFGMNATTMRKYIADDGHSFRGLVTAERKRRCDAVLAVNPSVNLQTLSDVCGFSVKQTMQQAFERWYDVTISEWRQGVL